MSNELWSEQFRIVSKDWVDKESAASLLEETKSAVMAQRMLRLGDIPVAHAERTVKGSPEWEDYLKKMVKAREAANLAKVKMEYIKMKAWEENSHEATKRAEMKI